MTQVKRRAPNRVSCGLAQGVNISKCELAGRGIGLCDYHSYNQGHNVGCEAPRDPVQGPRVWTPPGEARCGTLLARELTGTYGTWSERSYELDNPETDMLTLLMCAEEAPGPDWAHLTTDVFYGEGHPLGAERPPL
jgi:hypothetical protein